jgi:hypothetical protein
MRDMSVDEPNVAELEFSENLKTASPITSVRIHNAEMELTNCDDGQFSRTHAEKLEARLTFLSVQLESKTKEADAYKQQLKALESAQAADRKGLDLVEQLADSKRKVMTLQTTLAERKLLQPFSSLTSSQPVPLDKGFICSAMTQVGGKINGLARLDHAQICDPSMIAETPELSRLVVRAFPSFGSDVRHTSVMNRIPQSLRLKEVLRSLVAAALCCWVFDCPLDFLEWTPTCLTLFHYRECLEKQGMMIHIQVPDVLICRQITTRRYETSISPRTGDCSMETSTTTISSPQKLEI